MTDIYQIIENNGTPKNIEDRKARTNIAPYFNVNNANAAGDLILSDTGILYRFNAAYSAGTSWNSRTSKEQVNIDDELKNRISQINSSISTINSSINAIDSSLAIVSDGDTHIALSSGQYVYVKNHNTLAEGLYTANSSIGTNVALTSSNVTSVNSSNGGLNDLKNNINIYQNYTTDEVIVGKWQGITLYRKIFQGNCPTGEKTNFADLRSLNISYIVKMEGSVFISSGGNTDIVMVNSYYNSGNYLFVDYLNGYLRTNSSGFSGYLNVVVYYTKAS